MKKILSIAFCGLILTNSVAFGISDQQKSAASRYFKTGLKLGGAVCLTAGAVLLGKFFLKEWSGYDIHKATALQLRTEYLNQMAQEFPNPILRNTQGLTSYGFQDWAMQVMPDNHPFHVEASLAQPHDLFGMELLYVAGMLAAAGALVYDCFTGEITRSWQEQKMKEEAEATQAPD
jgi:hypothetical protein